MLHAGLDLSRHRLDICLVDEAGEVVGHTAAPPDGDGLRHLAKRLRGQPVRADGLLGTVSLQLVVARPVQLESASPPADAVAATAPFPSASRVGGAASARPYTRAKRAWENLGPTRRYCAAPMDFSPSRAAALAARTPRTALGS
jgi:hypothetical protein